MVIHFQYTDWNKNQLKQAWYRCLELIEGKRSARRINNTYSITLETGREKISNIPKAWHFNLKKALKLDINVSQSWYFKEIISFFEKYGVGFFEDLQIWHIQELKNYFIQKNVREPKSRTFPRILISLNNLKNNIKNYVKIF